MKVVIATDSLIERDQSTLIIEQLLQLFDQVEIFTLAHHPQNILGRIATIKVTSTYLSKLCKDQKDFIRKSWLFSSAAKTVKIPEDTDLVISISNGFGHGFTIPSKSKHIIYLMHFEDANLSLSKGWKKFIYYQVGLWRKYKLKNSDLLITSSQNLIAEKNKTVIYPFVKLDDFFYNPSTIKAPYYLVNLNPLTNEYLNKLLTWSTSNQVALKFVGKSKPEQIKLEDYIEESCDGVLAFYLNECQGFIDLSQTEFPQKAICSMAQARSVICYDTPINREFLPESMVFFIKSLDEMFEHWEKIDQSIKKISGPHLRRHALRFNARVFKSQFMSQIKNLILP